MSKSDEKKEKQLDISVPEEFALRDEVRWLKSEDLKLFSFLRETMNKIEPAYISTYPPSECGIATFCKDVSSSVAKYTPFSKPTIIAVKREHEIEPYERVVRFQILKENKQSYIDAAKFINDSSLDIVSIQHEYGIFGGEDGEYILDLLEALEKPAVATLHTVLQRPSPNQKRIMQEMGRLCEVMVVMIKTGRRILLDVYDIDPKKATIIPHGVPNVHRVSASSVKRALGLADRKILSTFGLISRGKGIEYVIQAMPKILEKNPNAIYLVLGETHPGVRKHEGESYRNMLAETISSLGLEDHVRFNNRFLSLNELVRYLCATDVYITPYLSKDQICSGTLAYAVGCGKAIASTPYLYAEEVLAEGRGTLVDFESPDSISATVNRILGDKELKESLESAAYQYGRRAAWFNVAVDYLDLFHRVIAQRYAARKTVEASLPTRETAVKE
ncbi:MAG: glycosyltransferase family 4 protein [Armatimonadetes bacterium]|nr:glycosyltransferase family 4 protein [Armatimonadota bacterium]